MATTIIADNLNGYIHKSDKWFIELAKQTALPIFEDQVFAVLLMTKKLINYALKPWRPFLVKAQPVVLNKRPPQIAPYQLHLDWQMWFAAMDTPDDYP